MTDQTNHPVTQHDVTQAISAMLVEVATGKAIAKTRLQNAIDASDAVNRRMQTIINLGKLQVEMKKHGIDFAASMRELRGVMDDTGENLQVLADQAVPGAEDPA